jgi:hypothetical protein
MPYHIDKRGDQYCVVKTSDGKVMGCHDTVAEALAQIAAIEASERKNYQIQLR